MKNRATRTRPKAPVTTSKQPFEKVRSLVERKQLFLDMIATHAEITCKGSDDTLFAFFPQQILSESLVVGYIKKIENGPAAGDIKIIGNFAVNEDRYFINSSLKVTVFEGVLHIDSDIYKLQRRASHRIVVPEDLDMYFTLKSLDEKMYFINAKFYDVSMGGARIYFPPAEILKCPGKPPKPASGMKLEGVVHSQTGKSIEVVGEVKHVLRSTDGQEHYGLEFKIDQAPIRNRLMSMVMEIQHKMVIGLS